MTQDSKNTSLQFIINFKASSGSGFSMKYSKLYSLSCLEVSFVVMSIGYIALPLPQFHKSFILMMRTLRETVRVRSSDGVTCDKVPGVKYVLRFLTNLL